MSRNRTARIVLPRLIESSRVRFCYALYALCVTAYLAAICAAQTAQTTDFRPPTLADVPEWVREYRGASAPAVERTQRQSWGTMIDFEFTTRDSPERVAETFRERMTRNGFNPRITSSDFSGGMRYGVSGRSGNVNVSVSTYAAASDIATTVSVSYIVYNFSGSSATGGRSPNAFDDALRNLLIVITAVVLIGGVLWLWALLECLLYEPSSGNERIVWALVIVFLNVLGALLYLLVRRPRRKAEVGR